MKSDTLNVTMFMILEEEKTVESRDYRDSRGLARIGTDRGMHICENFTTHCCVNLLYKCCLIGMLLLCPC